MVIPRGYRIPSPRKGTYNIHRDHDGNNGKHFRKQDVLCFSLCLNIRPKENSLLHWKFCTCKIIFNINMISYLETFSISQNPLNLLEMSLRTTNPFFFFLRIWLAQVMRSKLGSSSLRYFKYF